MEGKEGKREGKKKKKRGKGGAASSMSTAPVFISLSLVYLTERRERVNPKKSG